VVEGIGFSTTILTKILSESENPSVNLAQKKRGCLKMADKKVKQKLNYARKNWPENLGKYEKYNERQLS
jgi:hypothetical protein